MSKQYDNNVLSFRQFDRLDGANYVAYEFAWPVEVIECHANKVADGELDALAGAVLELLLVPDMTKKKIAVLLKVSDEVINTICRMLVSRGFFSEEEFKVTELGKTYIEKKETGEFLEEKVFGNMFVSLIDGDVLPFFYEGSLPMPRRDNEISNLLYDEENLGFLHHDSSLISKINKAYHRFGMIAKQSREKMRSGADRQIIEFVEETLHDRSYSEAETLAEIEEAKALKNARVKILNTPRKKMYLKARFCVKKAAPEKFIIDSPFECNITPWYSECFQRMRTNNALLFDYMEEEELSLDAYCDGITQRFYQNFPELVGNDFDIYAKINYPAMKRLSCGSVLMDKYHEVFNLNIFYEEGKVKRHTVITESAKAIELILNNYVHACDKGSVINKYERTIRTMSDVDNMLQEFGIDTSGRLDSRFKESKSVDRNTGRIVPSRSIMHSFRGALDGKTILEKYYFLIADAYFDQNSLFRQLLIKEDIKFITDLEKINRTRNKFGAHSDGPVPTEASDQDFDEFQRIFLEATRILIKHFR